MMHVWTGEGNTTHSPTLTWILDFMKWLMSTNNLTDGIFAEN